MPGKDQRIRELEERSKAAKSTEEKSFIRKQLEVIRRTAPGSVGMVGTPVFEPEVLPPEATTTPGGPPSGGRRPFSGFNFGRQDISPAPELENLPEATPRDILQRFISALTAPGAFAGLQTEPPNVQDSIMGRVADLAGILPSFMAVELALAKVAPGVFAGEKMLQRILRTSTAFGSVEAGATPPDGDHAKAFARGALVGVPFGLFLSPRLSRGKRFLGGAGIGATIGGPAPITGSKEEEILLTALLGALPRTRRPGPTLVDSIAGEVRGPQLELFSQAETQGAVRRARPGTDMQHAERTKAMAPKVAELYPEGVATAFVQKTKPFDPRFTFDAEGNPVFKPEAKKAGAKVAPRPAP